MAIRQKYQIALENPGRDFFIVGQLPYGQQAQADFGQCYLRCKDQVRKKVYFFVMMLSRSRMKYIYFLDKPFVISSAIEAHEAAFKYFEGISREVVYDQDRLFLRDENMGELLLTKEFGDYSYQFIKNCIENKVVCQTEKTENKPLPAHQNIRGKEYFTQLEINFNYQNKN